MARVLGSKTNKLSIFDPVGNGHAVFHTRPITMEERVQYSGRLIKKDEEGRAVIDTAVRLEFGEKILTGIGDNYFQNEDGKYISSNPASADYDPDWKSLITESAPELLMILAMHYFEGIRVDKVDQALKLEDEAVPLASGSGSI